jgi:hypothetical protein
MFAHHHVRREPLSVRERMSNVLLTLQAEKFVDFVRLFDPAEGRIGVTVTFLAILELLKEHLIRVVQAEAFGPIHVRAIDAPAEESEAAPPVEDAVMPDIEAEAIDVAFLDEDVDDSDGDNSEPTQQEAVAEHK